MTQVLQPGEQLGGYALVREIGRGAMGVVFEARSPAGKAVALKVLVPSPLLTPDERAHLYARFAREFRALSAVDHPNVVRIFEVGEDTGHAFLAMELLEGSNLRTVLSGEGSLPAEQAVALGRQLCEALDAVHHAGIVHRDVKPENLILLPDGTLKLTDFGVARLETDATLTRTGGVLGSPAYMSPEQILGRPIDRRSDVFSAAVTLYQLLADALPFRGEGLMELAHNVAYGEPAPLPASVPYPIAQAVSRGLQKSPGARYTTAGEFGEALRSAAAALVRRSGGTLASTVLSPAVHPDLGATVVDPSVRCSRHRSRQAVGRCSSCGRTLCPQCTPQAAAPFYCAMHTPVTLFGIPMVRLEVTLAALALLALLTVLSPFGYAFLRR